MLYVSTPRRRRSAFGKIASAAAIAVAAGAGVCSASEISIHVYNTNTAVDTLGPAGAGAARITGTWNDISNASNSSGTGIALVDSTGAGTSALLSYSGGFLANWTNAGSPLTGPSYGSWPTATTTAEDSQLFEGSLGTTQTTTPASATISNIPYASYNVYVYFQGSEGTNDVWQITDSGSGLTYYAKGDQFHGGYEDSNLTGYSLATATSQGSATYANYAVFSDTASSITLSLKQANSTGDGGGIYGIQIVATPEPASLSCVLTGGAALMLRRRRKTQSP